MTAMDWSEQKVCRYAKLVYDNTWAEIVWVSLIANMLQQN